MKRGVRQRGWCWRERGFSRRKEQVLRGMEGGKHDGNMENGAVWMSWGREQGRATGGPAGLAEGFPLAS